ncbi:MAG: hypothetical protein KC431_02070, partial [Myxococcales bacterium]|nr:hypothetical protein [Myxococcales bacterium]
MLLLTQLSCDQSGNECGPAETFAPIGPELFKVDYAWEPLTVTLYRSGDQIQLIEQTPDQAPREVRATMSASVLEAIEEAETTLGNGDPLGGFDGQCLTYIDHPTSRLSLAVSRSLLHFGYPLACPPSSFSGLDALLLDLVEAMP